MIRTCAASRATVHCRTGSSEKIDAYKAQKARVHCRTGSSENSTFSTPISRTVHCRTGSSESRDRLAVHQLTFTAAQAAQKFN